ncbi:manganese and iron superoxide dismutase [Piedraia hortae CBS 480.64]|uniref:Manganese and iron superoxide dismutase n=1 Tax=Piedraia hortae CBS 480.64 TaxID=1314780 RepID=A0A6A7C228_9PEZI|nr:manganese and iron superoxide dismutase [Piedraia hortae CBS 480.64]
MIPRQLGRPLAAFAPLRYTGPSCVTLPSASFVSPRRSLHKLPILDQDNMFRRHGIANFISPEAYDMAWTQYQQQTLNKLNDLLADDPLEHIKIRSVILQTAHDPMAAHIFNHASMAWNNHAFFSTLSSDPKKLEAIPRLQESLEVTFGSIENLKMTMLDTAAAMFGPGFVWLIWSRDLEPPTSRIRKGSWRILTTYIAGTPFAEAGYRQQGLDTNTNNSTTMKNYMNSPPINNVGAFGAFSRSGKEQASLPPGGANVLPVLCVNTWEHVWLRDYGMDGKRAYLQEWWNAIDWHAVDNNTPPEAKSALQFIRGDDKSPLGN